MPSPMLISFATINLYICNKFAQGHWYEDVSKSFRTGRLERELWWYSSLPLGAVVSLFCESV
jgi:hypothetical protein